MVQNMNIKRRIQFQNFSIIQWQDFVFVWCFLVPKFQPVAIRNLFLREENLDGYRFFFFQNSTNVSYEGVSYKLILRVLDCKVPVLDFSHLYFCYLSWLWIHILGPFLYLISLKGCVFLLTFSIFGSLLIKHNVLI